VTGRQVVVALGSNLGDRLATLAAAVSLVKETEGMRIVGVSPVYETLAVGGPEQGEYLNAVMTLSTPLSLLDVLARCQHTEITLGRRRSARWGPRTLDLDVIAAGSERSADPRCVVPHPRAHLRPFVLAPWRDLDPAAELINYGPIAALLSRMDTAGIRRTTESLGDLP
jgi:2-amino-4-hydroxy-6-hydroxymethyldihydropteridine diphosphokinase